MPSNRGRTPFENAPRPWFVGVDVGGTNTKLGIVDDHGQILAQTSIKTQEERGPEDAIGRIHQALTGLLNDGQIGWSDIAAVGLGTPGSQDLRTGWILYPPNMPHWKNFPIRDELAKACGKPCSYVNDANAAAYGEFWVGTGRDHPSMVMFTLGTGVGGGIILNGHLVNGEHSFGSELGHIIINCSDDARLCVWGGGRGQLEAYASASAVAAWAREQLAAGRKSSVSQRIAAGEELTTKMLAEEAEAGDKFSLEIILEAARYLGIGITSVVHTVDPGAIVIGGAMTFGAHATAVGRQFLETVRAEFQARCFGVVTPTQIDYAILGGDAGLIGAAGIARLDWQNRPGNRPASPGSGDR
jgi:glucokinase